MRCCCSTASCSPPRTGPKRVHKASRTSWRIAARALSTRRRWLRAAPTGRARSRRRATILLACQAREEAERAEAEQRRREREEEQARRLKDARKLTRVIGVALLVALVLAAAAVAFGLDARAGADTRTSSAACGNRDGEWTDLQPGAALPRCCWRAHRADQGHPRSRPASARAAHASGSR